ncbi:MAG: flagellar export chaperone FlgN [Treponema sp.]|nr:flagellar export chaperone FlgN [Treponema sp.]
MANAFQNEQNLSVQNSDKKNGQDLTEQEFNERVAILKRFRELLVQQRDKFREYLSVLEKHQTSIIEENTDALVAHTELEQQVVSSIVKIQKVIVPMSEMYASVSKFASSEDSAFIKNVQEELTSLQEKIITQNNKNRDLLRIHIAEIQSQMKQLKNPYRGNASVYSQKVEVGNLIEVNA